MRKFSFFVCFLHRSPLRMEWGSGFASFAADMDKPSRHVGVALFAFGAEGRPNCQSLSVFVC